MLRDDQVIITTHRPGGPNGPIDPGRGGGGGGPHRRPKSAADLMKREFAPIRFIVPGLIPEGLTLLAGRPKLGKSWLTLEVAIAVAMGSTCLGASKVEQGDVLVLALEDNERRLQNRIRKLIPAYETDPDLSRLEFDTEWSRAGAGGVEAIRAWIKSKPNPRLVIVDVLAMFRPARDGKENPYDADYHALKGLQALAAETGVAIVVVHHTRKGGGDADPFEKVSGTLGLSGAADTVAILDRDGTGATLYVRGRDVEEVEVAVEFDRMTCRWRALGNAAEVRRTDERTVIADLLADNREPMTPSEIADALGLSRNNVKQLIYKMNKAGGIVKVGKKGHYAHPDCAGYRSETPTADNPDNPITAGEKDQQKQREDDGKPVIAPATPITDTPSEGAPGYRGYRGYRPSGHDDRTKGADDGR